MRKHLLKFVIAGIIATGIIYANTTYMDLNLPTVSSTPGPTWATMLNNAFTTVDSHNHTSGKGVPIPSAGLGIDDSVEFNNNSATEVKSIRFQTQGASITATNSFWADSNGLPRYTDSSSTKLQLIGTEAPLAIGDIPYATSSTGWGKLAATTAGLFLKTNGAGTAPSFANPSVTTPISSKTHANTGYTLTANDSVITWTLTNGSNDTYTVPLAATVGAGQTYVIKLAATTANFNTLTGNRSGSDTFAMADGTSATSLLHQTGGESYRIISDGSSTWQVISHSTNSAWNSYTPTGTWVSNTTYTGFWRRVGDSIELQARLVLAGAPTSASLTVNIPSGLTIDTAKLVSSTSAQRPAFMSQSGSVYDANTGDVYGLTVAYSSTTAVAIFAIDASATYTRLTPIDQSLPVTFAGSDAITFNLLAPISGWNP